jgi:hypothetical protein
MSVPGRRDILSLLRFWTSREPVSKEVREADGIPALKR